MLFTVIATPRVDVIVICIEFPPKCTPAMSKLIVYELPAVMLKPHQTAKKPTSFVGVKSVIVWVETKLLDELRLSPLEFEEW